MIFSDMWQDQEIVNLRLGSVYKQRFKDAIKLLQIERGWKGMIDEAAANVVLSLQPIVLSENQRDAMNIMESTMTSLTARLHECTQRESELELEQKQGENDIDNAFKALQDALRQRQESMKEHLKETVRAQRQKLRILNSDLQGLRNSVNDGLQQQKKLLLSDQMDVKTKERMMRDIVRAKLSSFDEDNLKKQICSCRPIGFTTKQSEVTKVCLLSLNHRSHTVKYLNSCDMLRYVVYC